MINKIKLIIGAVSVFIIARALGVSLIIPLLLLCIFSYLKLRKLNYSLLNLGFLFVIAFASSYFIIRGGASIAYLPFAVIPMLATILFGELEISLLLSLAVAVSVASITGGHFYALVLFMISGISSSLLVLGARKRLDIIKAGLIVGILQAIILLLLGSFKVNYPLSYLILTLNGIISGFVVLGTLPVFETLFKTTTNISLLELADFNHPLLQRMILEAPGTYHHSLVVGNLSEAACRVVGANALLARIGAYYHDIGKVEKAEYFSENQNEEQSKHEKLLPTISKMVIMNHVKDGLELARKYKVNPRIMDFIAQHHGNSLVYYFYRRALETLEDDQQIKEDGFRYPGPKPNSKESAIVLLADSVEAATRTLIDPSPAKIEELVHKIINNKFIDGQLDECDLTLRGLEAISAVFIRILNGIYHSRIAYPEKAVKSESNHKKSSKENPHLSEKDKKSSS
jgi:putative nucleotidyltransferase with HDIG domain